MVCPSTYHNCINPNSEGVQRGTKGGHKEGGGNFVFFVIDEMLTFIKRSFLANHARRVVLFKHLVRHQTEETIIDSGIVVEFQLLPSSSEK